MRAGVVRQFGEAGQILVDNVPQPIIDGNQQVLINVKASSVNRLDANIRSGNHPSPPQLPYITGRDGAGVVEEVSPDVTQFKPGDRVFFVSSKNGANADYVVVDANFTFHLPNRLTFAQGATVGLAHFAAYRALFVRAFAQSGQFVLVHGASGGVGVAACQIAKVHGLRVFGTVGSAEGEQVAKTVGQCELVWNHNEADYVEKIKQQVPQGFNAIIEMVANINLNNDVNLLAKNGRVVIVGNRGNIEINPDETMAKEAQIVGLFTDDTDAAEYQRIAERIVGLLDGGHITPYVGQKFPLEQLPDAHNIIESSPAQGKIVLLHSAEESAAAENPASADVPQPAPEPDPAADFEMPEQPPENAGDGMPK